MYFAFILIIHSGETVPEGNTAKGKLLVDIDAKMDESGEELAVEPGPEDNTSHDPLLETTMW